MNKKVRLTEGALRQMIKESIAQILKEGTLYMDTKPFEAIYQAASEIMEQLKYTQSEDYGSFDDNGGDINGEVYRWAKEVAEGAVKWVNRNSSNQSINGGEDW